MLSIVDGRRWGGGQGVSRVKRHSAMHPLLPSRPLLSAASFAFLQFMSATQGTAADSVAAAIRTTGAGADKEDGSGNTNNNNNDGDDDDDDEEMVWDPIRLRMKPKKKKEKKEKEKEKEKEESSSSSSSGGGGAGGAGDDDDGRLHSAAADQQQQQQGDEPGAIVVDDDDDGGGGADDDDDDDDDDAEGFGEDGDDGQLAAKRARASSSQSEFTPTLQAADGCTPDLGDDSSATSTQVTASQASQQPQQ